MQLKGKLLSLCIAIAAIFQICGCGETHSEFYHTLVNAEGNYCFRNLNKYMTWEQVSEQEGLKDKDAMTGAAFYDYISIEPIPFKELGLSFRRGYQFETYTKMLTSASYEIYTDKTKELQDACDKLADFAEAELPLPDTGSADMLRTLPAEDTLDSGGTVRWSDRSENNGTSTELVFWVRPNPGGTGGRLRINIYYY